MRTQHVYTRGSHRTKRTLDPRAHGGDFGSERDDLPLPLEYMDEGPTYQEFVPVEPKVDPSKLPNWMEMAAANSSGLMNMLSLAGLQGANILSSLTGVQPPTMHPPRKRLDEATLNKIHSIKLEETPTMTHLYIPSHIASPKEEEAILKRNEAYRALLERRKEKDKYSSRFAQTLTVSQRSRQTQTPIIQMQSVGTQATTWSLYDELEGDPNAGSDPNQQRNRANVKPMVGSGRIGSADTRSTATTNLLTSTTAATTTATTTLVPGGKVGDDFRGVAPAGSDRVRSQILGLVPAYLRVISLPSFAQALRVMEAAVVQTFNYPQQLLYRSLISQTDLAKLSTTATGDAGTEGEAGAGSAAIGSNTAGAGHSSTLTGGSGATTSTIGAGLNVARNPTRRTREGKDKGRSGGSAVNMTTGSGATPTTSTNPNDRQIRLLWNLAPPCTFSSMTPQSATSLSSSGPNPNNFTIPVGLQVTCVAWNQQVPDLLAIGYGSSTYGQQSTGAICFWSLSNPTHPLRIYVTRRGVTALEFSPNAYTAPGGIFHMQALAFTAAEEQRKRIEGAGTNPGVEASAEQMINAATRAAAAEVAACGINLELGHLLAAGFSDGSVAVYDVREPHGRPAMQSVHPNSHRESVWSVRWTSAAGTRREPQLVTISSDGSVRLWQVERNFSSHEVIELKRVSVNSKGMPGGSAPSAGQSGQAGDASASAAAANAVTVNAATSSRVAVGLCLDVPLDDPTQYYVGTESGLIHRCSVSYNEQVLDNYTAHTGPVYQIRCSPFIPSYFLSCSADWTCQLWHQKSNAPIITFFLPQPDSMLDVQWSPTNSCVFLSLHRQGHLDIWDLSYSAVEPAVRYTIHSPNNSSQSQAPNTASGSGATSSVLSSLISTTTSVNQGAAGSSQSSSQSSQAQSRVPTCASFAPNASVIVVGCSDGSAMLLHVSGVDLSFERVLNKAAEQGRLMESVGKHNEQTSLANLTSGSASASSANPAAPAPASSGSGGGSISLGLEPLSVGI